MQSVARLIQFIVIIGVRKIGQFHLLRRPRASGGSDVVARQDDARDAALDHLAEDLDLLSLRQRFQVGHLGGAEDLDALVREIFEEAR